MKPLVNLELGLRCEPSRPDTMPESFLLQPALWRPYPDGPHAKKDQTGRIKEIVA